MQIKIALAQINPLLGDLAGNAAQITVLAQQAATAGAALMCPTEPAMSNGYLIWYSPEFKMETSHLAV